MNGLTAGLEAYSILVPLVLVELAAIVSTQPPLHQHRPDREGRAGSERRGDGRPVSPAIARRRAPVPCP